MSTQVVPRVWAEAHGVEERYKTDQKIEIEKEMKVRS